MDKRKISVGLDIGSITAKAVVAVDDQIERFEYRRTHGKPVQTAKKILEDIEKKYGAGSIGRVVTTGSGGKVFASEENAVHINEFQAILTAAKFLYPETKTIIEIGGETSKYILLDETGIIDYGLNGDCAAGTGSFIDQQAGRLHYKIEDIGGIVETAEKSAKIAGRCSVFAKSDMIHAQQMGYTPSEVLKGLCLAVARNFKAAIVKGRKIEKPVLFIGGVALNAGVAVAIRELFDLKEKDLLIPRDPEYFSAVGAALSGLRKEDFASAAIKKSPEDQSDVASDPLSTKDVVFLRDKIIEKELPKDVVTDIYMGIDVGSVSTNVVLMTETGDLIYDIYTRTKARPIEVVAECMKEVEDKFGAQINIAGVGTTGSGRELIGELVGADVIKDEITAHKTGAIHIGRTMTDGDVDTIFEIGGQDSKFIRIENGVVVDFTMNEACAAGTGSFLEEQAEKLGISIKEEFAKLALSSKHPIKMGERCTVFMERDVNSYQTKGFEIADIVAGLSYSVVLNYLNRVVRGRNIGNAIFFQGGTAYNDAVAAAFAQITGKKIIVPPYNGVIGAVGAALLAKDHIRYLCHSRACGNPVNTTFKGFKIENINYSIREFTCKACTNECDVQEFTVDGSKTYWGDKCSSKYRKKAKSANKATLSDLVAERNKLLLGNFNTDVSRVPCPVSRVTSHEPRTIGIPRAMYFFDRFPFWSAYLEGVGFEVIVSDETNRKIVESGIMARVSEPCHPIGVAHGHIRNLIEEKNVDYVWLPNILTGESNGQTHVRPYLCPWGMTLPYVAASSPLLEKESHKFLMPTLHHMHGHEFLSNQLYQFAKPFGVSKKIHSAAFVAGLEKEQKFRRDLVTLGEMALHKLDESSADAVVLVGRPYNICDTNLNLNIPAKIRNSYGVDVIPMDILPVTDTDITDVADHMFWGYGKKILSAAKFIGRRDNLHMIYITNFKCGPDSFIKHFAKEACGKPFLTLQFDEHSNDAGTLTRIEAYLDSKGLLNRCVTGRTISKISPPLRIRGGRRV